MVGIFVSYSRSAIILALILLILALMNQLRIKFKIAVIAVLVLFVSIFFRINEISQAIKITNPDLTKASVERRVYIWPVALKLILQAPLLGYGLENIGFAFSNYFQKNKHSLFEENLKVNPVLISLKELNIDRTHKLCFGFITFCWRLGFVVLDCFGNFANFENQKQGHSNWVNHLLNLESISKSIHNTPCLFLLYGRIDRST